MIPDPSVINRAAEIVNWWHGPDQSLYDHNNAMVDFGFIGKGVSRSCFRYGQWVIKVEWDTADNAANLLEFWAYQRVSRATLPDGLHIPLTFLESISGHNVIIMEYVEGEALGWRTYSKFSRFLEPFGIWDCVGSNVIVNDEGEWLIDLGSSTP